MVEQKVACLVYVAATANKRQAVVDRLHREGYQVREFKAPLKDALSAKAGRTPIPAALAQCIADADLCVFLLPEAEQDDCILGAAVELAGGSGKRVIGVVSGDRHQYPEGFEDIAESMLRHGSDRLEAAIRGDKIWERPDRSPVEDRKITHQRCQ